MQKIIAFAGKMQSGKSSGARFISGLRMKEDNIVNHASIDDNGDLLVNASMTDEKGNQISGIAILDIYRRDFDYLQFAIERIWPSCKVYSFAATLKESIIEIFQIDEELVYGNNEQKNTLTDIPKTDVDGVMTGCLTVRELLQEFGAKCRKLKPNCWVNSCLNRVQREDLPYCVIDDCRHANEVEKLKKVGAKIIRLKRNPNSGTHISETDLDHLPDSEFDYIINNENMTIHEKNSEILLALQQFGWTQGKIQ